METTDPIEMRNNWRYMAAKLYSEHLEDYLKKLMYVCFDLDCFGKDERILPKFPKKRTGAAIQEYFGLKLTKIHEEVAKNKLRTKKHYFIGRIKQEYMLLTTVMGKLEGQDQAQRRRILGLLHCAKKVIMDE